MRKHIIFENMSGDVVYEEHDFVIGSADVDVAAIVKAAKDSATWPVAKSWPVKVVRISPADGSVISHDDESSSAVTDEAAKIKNKAFTDVKTKISAMVDDGTRLLLFKVVWHDYSSHSDCLRAVPVALQEKFDYWEGKAIRLHEKFRKFCHKKSCYEENYTTTTVEQHDVAIVLDDSWEAMDDFARDVHCYLISIRAMLSVSLGWPTISLPPLHGKYVTGGLQIFRRDCPKRNDHPMDLYENLMKSACSECLDQQLSSCSHSWTMPYFFPKFDVLAACEGSEDHRPLTDFATGRGKQWEFFAHCPQADSYYAVDVRTGAVMRWNVNERSEILCARNFEDFFSRLEEYAEQACKWHDAYLGLNSAVSDADYNDAVMDILGGPNAFDLFLDL